MPRDVNKEFNDLKETATVIIKKFNDSETVRFYLTKAFKLGKSLNDTENNPFEEDYKPRYCVVNLGKIEFFARILAKEDTILIIKGIDRELQTCTEALVLQKKKTEKVYTAEKQNSYDEFKSQGVEVELN